MEFNNCEPEVLFWCLILLVLSIILAFTLGRMARKEAFKKRVEERVNERMRLMAGMRTVLYEEQRMDFVEVNADANVPAHIPVEHVRLTLAESIGNYILDNKLFWKFEQVTQEHHQQTFYKVTVKVCKLKDEDHG